MNKGWLDKLVAQAVEHARQLYGDPVNPLVVSEHLHKALSKGDVKVIEEKDIAKALSDGTAYDSRQDIKAFAARAKDAKDAKDV